MNIKWHDTLSCFIRQLYPVIAAIVKSGELDREPSGVSSLLKSSCEFLEAVDQILGLSIQI